MSQIQRNKTHWWSIVETLSLSVSVAGSITALVLQQTTLAIAASFSLSTAMGLNLLDRRQLERDVYQHKATIAQLERQHSEKFKYLDQALQLLPNSVSSDELKTIVHQIVEESQAENIRRLKAIEEFDLRSLKNNINQLQDIYPSLRERLEKLSENIEESNKELPFSKISEIQKLEARLDGSFLFQESILNRLQFLESFDLELLEKDNSEIQNIYPALRKELDDLSRKSEFNKKTFFEELTARRKEIQDLKDSLSLLNPVLSDFELRIQKLESLLPSTPLPSQIVEDSYSEKILNYFKDQVRKLEIKVITEPSPRIGGVGQAGQELVYISRDRLTHLVQKLNEHFNQRENIDITTSIQRKFEAEVKGLNGRRFASGIHVLQDQVIAIIENLKHEI